MKLISVSALYMALGVACGAFGAHALRDSLSPSDMAIWEKAVFYHLVHALAALMVASEQIKVLSPKRARSMSALLLVSVTVFSGSLYVLVLSGQRWLGMVTPLGGLGFIAAWLLLTVAAFRSRNLSETR